MMDQTTPEHHSTHPNGPLLPVTASARWQPLRSGLLNLYRYEDEVFHYHQGRLLLRGNNGTGKSRVLALQLPLLLDGDTSPHRVEPDGDPAKRFEWNLLMAKYEDRLGYTWIEFGRRDDGGQAHYLTLGCGLRAVKGRSGVARWFFVTPRRVGGDLHLRAAQGHALAKDALEEAIGGEGRIFTTASEYREEVNRQLFGMQQDRYEALLGLLIELRKPKLSRELDERWLSEALSNSLPPVSPRIIAQVADAMRGLEEDRQALEGLQAARTTTEEFLKDYRTYAGIVARRRAANVRTAHNTYENRQRKLRDLGADHTKVREDAHRLAVRQQELARNLAAAEGQKQTLENSPEMRSARDLDAAAKQAAERKSEALKAAEEQDHARNDLHRAAQQRHSQEAKVRSASAVLRQSMDQARQSAATCGVERQHMAEIEKAGLPAQQDDSALTAAERALMELADGRRKGARVLRDLNAGVASAQAALQTETQRRDEQAERAAETADELAAGEEALALAVEKACDDYRGWSGSLEMLRPAPVQEVVPAFREWVADGTRGTSPVDEAVARALTAAQATLADERAQRRQAMESAEQELNRLLEEQARLAEGVHEPPPVPHTRDVESRRTRSGAPLWLLCDFREGVPDEHRAAVEAALEASGMLDAWINPDGTVITEDFDTFLKAGDLGNRKIDQPTLRDLLSPSPHRTEAAAAVPDAVVDRILRRIGLGEGHGEAWVDLDGRWRIGPKFGRWAKTQAEHIGHAAREATRQRRLRELVEAIAASRSVVADIQQALSELGRRAAAAEAEADQAPNAGAVMHAVAACDALGRQLHAAQNRLAEAERRAATAREALTRTTGERDEAAEDLGLTEWTHRLDDLEDSISQYQQALVSLWSAARSAAQAAQLFRESETSFALAEARAGRLAQAKQEADQKLAAAEAHHEALRRSVGASAEQVQQRRREVDQRLSTLRREQLQVTAEEAQAQERMTLRAAEITEVTSDLDQDVRCRAEAVDHLLRFTRTGLLDTAVESMAGAGREEMSVTAAVELARRIESALEALDAGDNAWDRNQKLIHGQVQKLTAELQRGDYRVESTSEGDVFVVSVQFNGEQLSMRQFNQTLAERIVDRQALLTASEREVLENYLIHDVAVELGSLIRRAEELVVAMNQQLGRRPTSTGMQLQFKWETSEEAPPAFREARRRLLGDSATWSPQERTAVGEFLQEQIRRERESETSGTWQEQLTRALDYRRWHAFHVERKQDGKWQRLNRRTHGTGSGGEKALALTIPQFAAAAAYYDSADEHAPRLILLDEVFVGIDSDMRSKCMGLLHEFDFDFVMTSEREWGCYATMPGLAIYQLTASAELDAVWASRWVWNGREQMQDDLQQRGAVAASGSNGGVTAAGDGNGGLFRTVEEDR